jgi:hypothetical protein
MGAVWTQLLSEGGYFDFWASWSLVALACGVLGAYIALPPILESIKGNFKQHGVETQSQEAKMSKSQLFAASGRFSKWVERFPKGYGDAALFFVDVPGSVSCDGMGSCRAVHPRALC